MKTKIIVRPTARSVITILKRRLKGFAPRKPFVWLIDQQRDTYRAPRRFDDVGAQIAPPKRRKPGRKATNALIGNNRVRSATPWELKYSFVCEYSKCDKKGMAKSEKRRFCDNNGRCLSRFTAERKKAEK